MDKLDDRVENELAELHAENDRLKATLCVVLQTLNVQGHAGKTTLDNARKILETVTKGRESVKGSSLNDKIISIHRKKDPAAFAEFEPFLR